MLSFKLKRAIRKRVRKFLNIHPGLYDSAREDLRNWFYEWYRSMSEGEPSSELMEEVERYINEVSISVT